MWAKDGHGFRINTGAADKNGHSPGPLLEEAFMPLLIEASAVPGMGPLHHYLSLVYSKKPQDYVVCDMLYYYNNTWGADVCRFELRSYSVEGLLQPLRPWSCGTVP